ncbi:integrase [Microvirga lupini]|uniref:Integrase n=1 Tax=Microvirga lupini TaxID=420324 RepID=A0A7W4VP15_9HYPH|nr:tyrosine-type recombinase/integrase [Microvirga lupini]MBB3020401.1 integrase [Microvirga lupini]
MARIKQTEFTTATASLRPADINVPLALLEDILRKGVSASAALPKARRGRKPSRDLPCLDLRVRGPSEPIWYLHDEGGFELSTGFRESQRDEAEAFKAAYTVIKLATRLGAVSPLAVTVSAICAHALSRLGRRPDRMAPRHPGDPKARKADNARREYDRKVREIGRINHYFGDTPMGEVTERALRQYLAERLDQPLGTCRPGASDVRLVQEGTVRKELIAFRKAVADFAQDRKVFGLPPIWVPRNSPHRTRYLTRSECARLVGAALGFVWDTAAGAWKREAGVVEGRRVWRLVRRPPAVRKTRRALLRFIMIGLYTGTRNAAVRALRWRLNRDTGAIDVEGGVLHRQGLGVAPNRGKRQPAVDLPERLLRHLRRWRAMDEALGTDFVIHKPDGTPYWQRLEHLWDTVAADAGFGDDPEVIPHALRHTCATWLRLSRVRLEEAADYLGMDPVTLIRVYGQRTIDGHAAATAAMDNARDLRHRRVMGGTELPRGLKPAKGPAPKPVWLAAGELTSTVLPARAAFDLRPGRAASLAA